MVPSDEPAHSVLLYTHLFHFSIIFFMSPIYHHAPHQHDLLYKPLQPLTHCLHWTQYQLPHWTGFAYLTDMIYGPHCYISISSLPDAPYHSLTPHWWVYPLDTLLWPPIFDFLSFSLHRRSSNMHHTNTTFHDLHAITIDYTLYPLHHWPGTTSETSHMTYGPRCCIFLS